MYASTRTSSPEAVAGFLRVDRGRELGDLLVGEESLLQLDLARELEPSRGVRRDACVLDGELKCARQDVDDLADGSWALRCAQLRRPLLGAEAAEVSKRDRAEGRNDVVADNTADAIERRGSKVGTRGEPGGRPLADRDPRPARIDVAAGVLRDLNRCEEELGIALRAEAALVSLAVVWLAIPNPVALAVRRVVRGDRSHCCSVPSSPGRGYDRPATSRLRQRRNASMRHADDWR